MKKTRFGFEDLEVWQKAVDFANRVINLTEKIQADRKHFRLIEQLEAASTSIALNIAEGKGRYSKKEFVQYLYIARGSLYETITLLIIFNKNKWISEVLLDEMKAFGNEIGKMLSGLINSIKNSQVSS
ncbi:MAG TPA: four helix bundle protein [Candidatus Brocadiales bacterium]|nr:four helix bundle protein [Candidatus Brocadiales bacterium]